MKFVLFMSNVYEQYLLYKVYGKVDFYFNKSEFKENKKKKIFKNCNLNCLDI